MKFLASISLLTLALAANAQGTYKVIASIPSAPDGAVATMINYDNGAKIDSAVCHNGAATFEGQIDEPIAIRLFLGDQRLGSYILDEGSMAINTAEGRASGSMLNDQMNLISKKSAELDQAYENAANDAQREKILAEYKDFLRQTVADNVDNPIGLFNFLDLAYILDANEILDFIDANPYLKNYARVQNFMVMAQAKKATSEGQHYVDFEAVYNGQNQKFSDYVEPGKYTLVDFWASWCGPCRKEMKVIKELYEKYHDKGLNVVGVAVWDEPENTATAMRQLGISWPVMMNTQNVATDAYGILGIPSIVVIGPDGTIISRDARGEGLKAVIANALNK